MQTVSRLITTFTPETYTLSLDLRKSERTFTGTVTITGISSSNATHIAVHSKDLNVSSVTIDGKKASFSSHVNDELHISHPQFQPGKHIVVISFSGTIKDSLRGLYPCYFEHDGTKKELLATQFESHHAREVFPCIDEPEAKATFNLTLTTETDITVLSNMPLKNQRIENDRLVSQFDTSPRMSTYLLAWVAGELHKKSAKTERGVEVNIWATPAQSSSSLDFALDTAVRAIEFYEEYFDTEYPLPKSDHVALPDFSVGAMENWGLITYRETALLADPRTTSISSKQYIATVIAHELAHQWFGNLVTMRWWNNLWLNESFANMMEYLTVDHLYPEWNIWLDFATNEAILALRRDSIDGVQSVQTDVHHPDEIGTLFDGAIVYAKGGRLLRMLQHYIGDHAFQAGLKQYFKKHAYSNTEADDLWDALARASGKDISGLMNTWISQPGFPVVRVVTKDDSVTLSQNRFFVGPHKPSSSLWPIPLNASDNATPSILATQSVTYTRTDTAVPVRLNADDSAHFITHYDAPTLTSLLEQVSQGLLQPIDRLQLLHESTLLARAGAISSADLIRIIDVYKNETSEHVWTIMFVVLSELRKFVETNSDAEKKLRALSGKLAAPQYARLGWQSIPGEGEDDTKLRATVINLMIYSEDSDAIATAQELYDNNALEDIDGELRPLVISSVTRNGKAAIVDTLLDRYASSHSGDLQQDICIGITSTRDTKKISQLLDTIKDPTTIRPQDAARWFVYLIRGKDSRALTWEWLQHNWAWVDATFKGDINYDMFVRYSASGLMTRQHLSEYTAFFSPMMDDPALKRTITMGISEIQGRVELIEKDGPAVQEALLNL